ncbi:histidine phosphatase family protein [Bifidobacterium sp. SMB2]|uniref:Histidine phosphatase family protein n=1 Tax=Bifidobacterium saimiriisciurei TaxID=2661627 RepID=A0ABX0C6D6_9BIFI|nr:MULTISPECIES: histidine phosphatase family protein [Bifidobacterium]NEG96171.1 histidine phosphatase family protein [Bifidobacterium sp. SMB2]NEH10751.1 histidine phosphatase family protein [Bifidobacterium saimiriisciurei]
MITEVVLVRHGRTPYNLAHRLQGQVDVPLDIIGQWQADQTGYELARRYYWAKVSNIASHPELLAQPGPDAACPSDISEYHDAPASRRRLEVYSSDLFRAQQTAHAFADLLGLPVTCDARLRERSFGRWEGLTREQIRQMDARAYASWRAHTGGELEYGVESRTACGRRGMEALNDIVSRHADDDTDTTLVVVSHGSWIVATVETLVGIDPDRLNSLGSMRNAFWSRLVPHHRDGSLAWSLEEFNTGPQIAGTVDWENGPQELRNERMPGWQPIVQ